MSKNRRELSKGFQIVTRMKSSASDISLEHRRTQKK